MRPPDMTPAAVLAERHPHGTRVRYVIGCRCLLCRAAASRYECARAAARKAGDWNGPVPAERARRHLLKLSRQGVGGRAVAEACDVSRTVIVEVRAGRKRTIRARTERAILAVDRQAVSDGALVPAGRTLQRIKTLLAEGFTKAELARRLGYQTPALQLRAKGGEITARNAARVERPYNRVMVGA